MLSHKIAYVGRFWKFSMQRQTNHVGSSQGPKDKAAQQCLCHDFFCRASLIMKELNDIMWANVWQEKQWPGFDIKLVKVSETLCFTPLIVIPVELKTTFTVSCCLLFCQSDGSHKLSCTS